MNSILPIQNGEYTLSLKSGHPVETREYTGFFVKSSGHWYPPSPHYHKWNTGYLDRIVPYDEDQDGYVDTDKHQREYTIVGVAPAIFRYKEPVERYYTDRWGQDMADMQVIHPVPSGTPVESGSLGDLEKHSREALLDSMEGEVCFVVTHGGLLGVMAEIEWPIGDDQLHGDIKQEMEALVRDYRRRFKDEFPEVEIYATQGDHVYGRRYAMRAFAPLCAKMKGSKEYRDHLKNNLFSTIIET